MDPYASTHPSVIPGILDCPSLNMLAGASGLGKTAFLAAMAQCLLRGDRLLGHEVTAPPAVGYLSADRTSPKEWFNRAGLDIPTYSLIHDLGFDLKQLHGGKHGPLLLAHCLSKVGLPPGSVVIVDPIALFLGGKLNDYNSVAVACVEIQRMLLTLPYVLIGVCHTSKLKADVQDRYARPQDRILGSTALLGYSATQMYLMGPDEAEREDGRYTFVWNPHYRKGGEYYLTRNEETGLFTLDTAESADALPPGPRLVVRNSERLDAILALYPPYPETISTAQLLLYLGTRLPPSLSCSRAQFFRDVDILVTEKKVERFHTRGLWRRCAPADKVPADAPPQAP